MLASVITQPTALQSFRAELGEELDAILEWWMQYMQDQQEGGFYGSVDNNNKPGSSALKGIVLNSRILWTFSAAYQLSNRDKHLQMAKRAFDYIVSHFKDPEHGGVYWSVDTSGKMYDGRKQIYGQAFCIYGMTEYYKATGEQKALEFAKEIYNYIGRYSYDNNRKGYIEAFARDWKSAEDLRLSEKDDNEKKTMNTHLHIIEAYASLYTVWPDTQLKEKIIELLKVFSLYIINPEHSHLNLFMDEDWNVRSSLVSFGHDIEAAWLLLECAEIAGDKFYFDQYKDISIELANAAERGLNKSGGLWYEYDPATDTWVYEHHSWPQAEAVVGFYNAYQLTGDSRYLHHSMKCWDFIKDKLKDTVNGEWFWGIHKDGSLMQKEKAGFWKCPYHGARACMEMNRRLAVPHYNCVLKI